MAKNNKTKTKFKDMPIQDRNRILGCIICLIALITAFVVGWFVGSFMPSNKAKAMEKATTYNIDDPTEYLYGRYDIFYNHYETLEDMIPIIDDYLNSYRNSYFTVDFVISVVYPFIEPVELVANRLTWRIVNDNSIYTRTKGLFAGVPRVGGGYDYYPVLVYVTDYSDTFQYVQQASYLVFSDMYSLNLDSSLELDTKAFLFDHIDISKFTVTFNNLTYLLDNVNPFDGLYFQGLSYFSYRLSFEFNTVDLYFVPFFDIKILGIDYTPIYADGNSIFSFDAFFLNNAYIELSFLGFPTNTTRLVKLGTVYNYDMVAYSLTDCFVSYLDNGDILVLPFAEEYSFQVGFTYDTTYGSVAIDVKSVDSDKFVYSDFEFDEYSGYYVSTFVVETDEPITISFNLKVFSDIGADSPIYVTDFVDWLVVAVGGFFDFAILPGLSLGVILGTILLIGVVIWLLKVFAGG